MYPSIILEFNIATNTQVGRINIWNIWKVKEKTTGKEMYIKDPGNAHDFEWADIKEGTKIVKIRKQVDLYEDREYTKPIALGIDYIKENYETLEYRKVYEHENAFKFDKYTRSGEFIENLVTDNIIEFSKRWLHLAGFNEILEDLDEYYYKNSIGPYKDNWNTPIYPISTGKISPIRELKGNRISPIRLIDRKKEMAGYERVDPRKNF